jgi:CheY-like chemotaxis protein
MSTLDGFGKPARDLAKNPLGIIALFIVLVYAMAALVLNQSSNLNSTQRWPLVGFLVLFPAVVLTVFYWLVINHTVKLYGPGDFKDPKHWLDTQVRAGVAIGAAIARDNSSTSSMDVKRLADVVSDASYSNSAGQSVQRSLLWVDDRGSDANKFARTAFEALGWQITLALTTDQAISLIQKQKYDAIISDLRRPEGDREGHRLLTLVRNKGINTPFYIHSGQNSPELQEKTRELGGNGHTGSAGTLFELVIRNSLAVA